MPKRSTKKSMPPRSKKRIASTKVKLASRPRINPVVLAIIVFAVALLGFILIRSRAATTVTITNPPNSSSTCGARVSNYSYAVPFGKSALNVPVCGMPKHPKSDEFVRRWYNYSNANDGSPQALAARGIIDFSFNNAPPATNWARTLYTTKEANIQRQVMTCISDCYLTNLDGGSYDKQSSLPSTPIPWNNGWVVAQAGDNEVIIHDPDTGKMWVMSGIRNDPATAFFYCGPFVGDRLCGTSFYILRNKDGNVADYRTYEGTGAGAGLGTPMLEGMVLPEEVAAGEIRHAMTVVTFNTARGPECTPAQRGTAAENVTCGTAIAPAGRFELGAQTGGISQQCNMFKGTPLETIYTQDKLIPEGTRFALNIDDAGIEAWIKTRADLVANPRKAETARIVARALRDYGIVIADTSCSGTAIQTPGGLNPATKQKWEALGLTGSDPVSLIQGLTNDKNMYMVDTPINYCTDGTQSKYACGYTTSRYPGVNYDTVNPSTPPPTTTQSTTVQPTTPPASSSTVTSTVTTAPATVKPSTPPATTQPSTCVPSFKQECPAPPPPASTDNQPPTAPTYLSAGVSWDPTRFKYIFTVGWQASTDNVGVLSYQVYKNDKPLGTVADTKIVDDEATVDLYRTYKVTAKDVAGNVSPSVSKTAVMRCFLIFCWAE